MGKVDNLPQIYKGYSLMVLPSYREGLPMALLEAQMNKMPIVSFDVATGPSEIVTDGLNGFLVPPKDTDAMAEKINYLIDHEEVLRSFSEHADDNIGRFSAEGVARQWEALFESLMR